MRFGEEGSQCRRDPGGGGTRIAPSIRGYRGAVADDLNQLGDFLRARRELVTPEMVGIPVLGTRRVPGLRREEVAMLAGISADYYLRLEQGRDRHPSSQVLEALARVLQLDERSTAYLLALPATKPRRGRRASVRREVVPAGILKLLDLLDLPAFVEGRYLDVLAANPLATALSPRLVAGGNRLRDVFLDPAEQAMFPQQERAAAALVAGFRESVGTDVDDPRFIELVGELSLASPLFRELWARHDVGVLSGSVSVQLDHPQVGMLEFNREKLLVSGADRVMLVIYHPDAGSDAAEKLRMLSSLAVA